MPNIKIVIEYDGTNYKGWQVQPNKTTIQGAISEAIFKISGERVKLISSGRTDAGTHAKGQVANFHVLKVIKEASFQKALNSLLPWDIRIKKLVSVGEGFHARSDATSKIYQYHIYMGRVISPFLYRFYFHFSHPLDVSQMSEAAKRFLGKHNFTAFTPASSQMTDSMRAIYQSRLVKKGAKIIYRVEGSGFLRYMVRNMVGTLIEIGRGRATIEALERMLSDGQRQIPMFTVPAHGLLLVKVKY